MNRLQKRNSRKRNDSGKSKGAYTRIVWAVVPGGNPSPTVSSSPTGRRGSSADEDDDEDDGSGDSHSGTTHRSRSQSVNSAGSESAAAISRGLSNLVCSDGLKK